MRWSIEVLHILRKGRMKNVTDNKHNKYHWKGAPLVDSVLTFKFLWNFTSVEQLTFSAWKVVLILIISFSGMPLVGGAFYTLFVYPVESLLEISQCSAREVDIWTLETFSKWSEGCEYDQCRRIQSETQPTLCRWSFQEVLWCGPWCDSRGVQISQQLLHSRRMIFLGILAMILSIHRLRKISDSQDLR